MRRTTPALFLSMLLSICIGCSSSGGDGGGAGGGPDTVVDAPPISTGIGPEGGVLEGDGATLEVPAGALDETVELTLEARTDVEAPEGWAFAGSVFSIGPAGTVFAEAVTLTLPLDTTVPEAVVLTRAGSDTAWEDIGGAVDGAAIRVEIAHLSDFAPAVPGGCGPGTCDGCCQDGVCVEGEDDDACGEGGAACMDCPAATLCIEQICQDVPTCEGGAICPGGCCAGPVCHPGDKEEACGLPGHDCHVCPEEKSCVDNVCACPEDTWLCGDECCEGEEECTDAGCCVPDCDGKQCGDNGCGGSCGDCGANEECEDSGLGGMQCFCAHLACGGADDAVCCEEGQACVDGACCTPDCGGKECGDDGCGGESACPPNEMCEDLLGDAECVCEFLACGPGDECCAEGDACFDGACCTPDCGGKECGDNDCGGTCGDCAANEVCEVLDIGGTSCLCAFEACGDDVGVCCAEGETCTDGQCVPPGTPCDPPSATYAGMNGAASLIFDPNGCTCNVATGNSMFSGFTVTYNMDANTWSGAGTFGWNVASATPASVQVQDGAVTSIPANTPVSLNMADSNGMPGPSVGFTATNAGIEDATISCP